jgi:hypothetical protein
MHAEFVENMISYLKGDIEIIKAIIASIENLGPKNMEQNEGALSTLYIYIQGKQRQLADMENQRGQAT